jgi:hypothetical protein
MGMIDIDTGELLLGTPVWVRVRYSLYGNRWFMANQQALLTVL